MVISKEDIVKMEDYLRRLKTELVMRGYHDGWAIKWLEKEIDKVESKIKKIKLTHKLK